MGGTLEREKHRSTFVPFREKVSAGQIVVEVCKRRSSEHLPPKARGAVRALGLNGCIGTANLQPDTPETWGSVRRVRAVVAANRVRYTGTEFEPVEPVMTVRAYDIQPGEGAQVSYDGQPLAWLEEREEGQALTWIARSGISPDVLAKRTAKIFGRAMDRIVATAYDDQGEARSLRGGVVGSSPLRQVQVVSYRASDKTEVLWQRSIEDPAIIEIGVIEQKRGADPRTIELARVTGTFALSRQIGDLALLIEDRS